MVSRATLHLVVATFADAAIFDETVATSAAIIAGMALCIVDCCPAGAAEELVVAACMSVAAVHFVEHRTMNVRAAFVCPIVVPSDDSAAGFGAVTPLAPNASCPGAVRALVDEPANVAESGLADALADGPADALGSDRGCLIGAVDWPLDDVMRR